MPAEVQSYRLTYRGKPAGTHTLTTFAKGATTFMEGRMLLQGSLRGSTVQQRSRFHSQRFHSQRFEEDDLDRGGKRSFRIDFDAHKGLVEARQGQDVATQPYLLPYRDPLSMLHELRALDERTESVRIPMLGKEVTARMVGTTVIDTPFGERNARTFLLSPGGSYVYLDSRAPHLILKLVQRIDDNFLEAILIRVGQEDEMPDWSAPKPAKRRRSRRRRGRRSRSNSRSGNKSHNK